MEKPHFIKAPDGVTRKAVQLELNAYREAEEYDCMDGSRFTRTVRHSWVCSMTDGRRRSFRWDVPRYDMIERDRYVIIALIEERDVYGNSIYRYRTQRQGPRMDTRDSLYHLKRRKTRLEREIAAAIRRFTRDAGDILDDLEIETERIGIRGDADGGIEVNVHATVRV